jgi:diacylglycerol kinase family enzyme
MRIALIVNPRASGVRERDIERVRITLSRAASVVTMLTERRRHASELSRRASESFDAIVVFSGDGTYGEVVNGLAGDVPLGFVPGGATSVLPRALGLGRDPVEAAQAIADALLAGSTRRISLGSVNGYRFTFEAGIGVDAEAVRRVDALGRRPDGRRPGDLAFVRSLAAILAERRGRFEPVLEIAGFGSAAFAVVANGDPATFAGPFPVHMAPEARFELGLDLVAPVRVQRRTLPALLAVLFLGRGHRRPGVIYGHDLDRIEIECREPQPLQADGEDLGDVRSAVFECHRSALAILAP